MVQKWYIQAMSHPDSVAFETELGRSVIYKGFKLTDTNDGRVVLEDCRRSNYYSRVSKIDKRMFRKFGFIMGADLIQYQRDGHRVHYYTQLLSRIYGQLGRAKARLKAGMGSVKRNRKNIQIFEGRILKHADNLYFYETRRRQAQRKYNLNKEK